MDKFILNRAEAEDKDGYKMLNIRKSTYDQIIQMREESGLKIVDIVAKAVQFAFERMEVVDESNE